MHPQIEGYLAQVQTQLQGLSPDQRSEEVRELGQHLQILVEEGRGKGLSEGEAVRAALSQFGPYRKVGRDLNQAVLGQTPHLSKALSAVTIVMIGQVVLGLLIFVFLFLLPTWGTVERVVSIIVLTLIYYAVAIYVAVSLRRMRPWAFWLALIFLSYEGILTPIGDFTCNFIWSSVYPNVLAVLAAILSFSLTLFCLTVLILNRKNYLQLARAKSSG